MIVAAFDFLAWDAWGRIADWLRASPKRVAVGSNSASRGCQCCGRGRSGGRRPGKQTKGNRLIDAAMTFDPYTEWLRIPAGRRPPSHYELLGISAFEADAQRISQAAVERLKEVRRHQEGQHAAESSRLQGELVEALDCLTNPEKKQGYDDRLRTPTPSPELLSAAPVDQPSPAPMADAGEGHQPADKPEDLYALKPQSPPRTDPAKSLTEMLLEKGAISVKKRQLINQANFAGDGHRFLWIVAAIHLVAFTLVAVVWGAGAMAALVGVEVAIYALTLMRPSGWDKPILVSMGLFLTVAVLRAAAPSFGTFLALLVIASAFVVSLGLTEILAWLFKLLKVNGDWKQRACLALAGTTMLVLLLLPTSAERESEWERQEAIRQVEELTKGREMLAIERGERAPDGAVIDPKRRMALSIEAGVPIAIPEQEAKDAVSTYIKEREKRLSEGRLSSFDKDRKPLLVFNFNGSKGERTLSVGAAAFLFPPRILHIEGPTSAEVWIDDKIVLAIGWPTSGKVDGEKLVDLMEGSIVSAIHNTGGSTIYVIQPFDLYGRLSRLGEL